MAEALEQVKRRFGRDAVILHTRTFRKGGWFGFGGQPMVEITAAGRTFDLPPDGKRASMPTDTSRRAPRDRLPTDRGTGSDAVSQGSEDSVARALGTPGGLAARERRPFIAGQGRAEGAAGAMADLPTVSAEPTGGPLLEELRGLKVAVQDLARHTRPAHVAAWPDSLADAYLQLVQRHVAEEIAIRLVERVRAELGQEGARDRTAVDKHLARYVESMLPVGGPIRVSPAATPTRIALVGPTGVGKTTTIAKLAASFSLRQGRKVGLLTIDTFRIAAVDQLRTYARIINVPLEVVLTPDRMQPALRAMSDRDLVFIDTAGRSQNDPIRLNELRCFLDEAKPHEIHLVLSSTCRQGVLLDTIERYRKLLNINRVIFTKLDEAIGFGTILTCLTEARACLSYVTTGQEVPDDLEVGRTRKLADLIVRGTRLAKG